MKEDLLQKVSDWIVKTTEQIGDFAAREIPPFIHEYLQWKFWECIINISVHLILVVFIVGLAITLHKTVKFLWNKHLNGSRGDSWDFGAILSAVLGVAALLSLSIAWILHFPVQDIKDCIQIKIAPKVYLVEKASEIYKGSK